MVTNRSAPQNASKRGQETTLQSESPSPVIAPEFDSGADLNRMTQENSVHRETRVQSASESEIDSHLRSLTRKTSIAELTRAGKTHNLKTLSEQDLKEWIKEALRQVISTTTSIGVAEREELIAKTRTTLAAIMVERQAAGAARDDDLETMAVLTAERDELERLLATSEAKGESRISDMQHQLSAALERCAAIVARVPDLEARLARALADPVADPQEVNELREQLGIRVSDAAISEARGEEFQRIAREVMGRLVRERERAQVDSAALIERIASTERAHSDLDRHLKEADRRACEAEASLARAASAAAVAAELARSTEKRTDLQRAGSDTLLKDSLAERARLIDEVGRISAAAAVVQKQLAEAVLAAAETRIAAEGRARQDQEVADRERQLNAAVVSSANAKRQDAEQSLTVSQDVHAGLIGERDRLTMALGDAEKARGGIDTRLRAAEVERDAARRQTATASKRATVAEKALAGQVISTPNTSLSEDVTSLQNALIRARAIVTNGEGVPREDVMGELVLVKPRRWLTVWRDVKGRLKVGRSVGDHWMKAGRATGVPPIGDLTSEPVLLARGDGIFAAWRDTNGHARLVSLDGTGRISSIPLDLGPSLTVPALSRGGGKAASFVVTTDSAGHVHLRDREGGDPVDLTQQLEAPPASGLVAAWHWPLEGSRHIAYRDAVGAIHEYLELKGVWFHAALSAGTGSPAAAADPIGYAPSDHEHIVYLGIDGHIHELCFDARVWRHNDLTASSGAGAAAGRPSGAYTAGRHTIVFRGVDGYAHCLILRRDWRHVALADLGAITDDPQLACNGLEGALTFRRVNGERYWARFSDPRVCAVARLPI